MCALLYNACGEEQQLYAPWSVWEAAYGYEEEFAFGGSLVWYRIANIWYLHNIYLHHVATYYVVEMCHVVRGTDCGSNGEKLSNGVSNGSNGVFGRETGFEMGYRY